ncbi:MAG: hypothetical protein HP042_04950 [Lachnospiraceae bacterium]|nr:hypothetical protein [Lachnospiraceae bacterium]
MAIKGLKILLWFLAVPYGIGNLPAFQKKNGKQKTADALISGYAGMFTLFELLALPLIFGRQTFSFLKVLYGMLCLVLAAAGWWSFWKKKEKKSGNRNFVSEIPPAMWAAMFLIAVQMGAYVFGMATDLDDSFYVATATTTMETNGMFTYGAYTGKLSEVLPSRYVLSPFPILLAFYSEAVSMHAAVVAHTVEPVFFLLVSYLVYVRIAEKLFPDDRKGAALFLLFVAWIQMFSYYSVYTQGTFMTIRIWQGKAVLASFLLPGIFYQSKCCMEAKAEKGDWIRLVALMLASCLVSSMGIMLAPVMLGLMTVLFCLRERKWKTMGKAVLCCIPNLLCAVAYLMVR